MAFGSSSTFFESLKQRWLLWDDGTKIALSLKDSWTTKTGVTVLTYTPATA